MVPELGSLTTANLMEKVKGLQNLAYQLGLEECKSHCPLGLGHERTPHTQNLAYQLGLEELYGPDEHPLWAWVSGGGCSVDSHTQLNWFNSTGELKTPHLGVCMGSKGSNFVLKIFPISLCVGKFLFTPTFLSKSLNKADIALIEDRGMFLNFTDEAEDEGPMTMQHVCLPKAWLHRRSPCPCPSPLLSQLHGASRSLSSSASGPRGRWRTSDTTSRPSNRYRGRVKLLLQTGSFMAGCLTCRDPFHSVTNSSPLLFSSTRCLSRL